MLLNVLDDSISTTVVNILDDIHNVLRSYIRALVLLAVASFSAWVCSSRHALSRMNCCWLVSPPALEFIPVVGPAAALAIMLTVFIATGTADLMGDCFLAGVPTFQDYVLSPYLMSSGVELHPLLVLFGVLAGDALAGVPGMFFSVPILAILRAVFNRMEDAQTKRSDPTNHRPSTNPRIQSRLSVELSELFTRIGRFQASMMAPPLIATA